MPKLLQPEALSARQRSDGGTPVCVLAMGSSGPSPTWAGSTHSGTMPKGACGAAPPDVEWTLLTLAERGLLAGCSPCQGLPLRVTLTLCRPPLSFKLATLASEYIPHLEQDSSLLPPPKTPAKNLCEECTSACNLSVPEHGLWSKADLGHFAPFPHLLHT